jgi:hypothetical protein
MTQPSNNREASVGPGSWIEQTTGWSIKRFVRTARRYRTIQIEAGAHTLTAADPLPDDLRSALASIHRRAGGTHQFEPSRETRRTASRPAPTGSCKRGDVYPASQASQASGAEFSSSRRVRQSDMKPSMSLLNRCPWWRSRW